MLRPGGAIAIVDLDATVPPYGEWMRADLPRYDPAAVEAFFAGRGFSLRRVPTVWRFPDRATRDAVLRIEFSRDVAERAIAATAGLAIPVGYRLHVRRRASPRRLTGADLGRAGPPAAHRARAGTVGGPVGGDGTVRAQAGRGSGIRGAGPRGRRRLAGRLGGPAERSGARWCSPSASRSPRG